MKRRPIAVWADDHSSTMETVDEGPSSVVKRRRCRLGRGGNSDRSLNRKSTAVGAHKTRGKLVTPTTTTTPLAILMILLVLQAGLLLTDETRTIADAFVVDPATQRTRSKAAFVGRSGIGKYESGPAALNAVVAKNDSSRLVLEKGNTATQTKGDEPASGRIPFVIEKLSHRPPDRVYKEISEMCIEAFFNDGIPGRTVPVWKEWQLQQLLAMQVADLRFRRKNDKDNGNMMFVARRVVPVSPSSKVALDRPLILDTRRIRNMDELLRQQKDLIPAEGRSPFPNGNNGDGDFDYVCGEVLGFVEVTKRPYGIGSDKNELDINKRTSKYNIKRPVLTNLSVPYDARKSGVGSALVQVVEDEVYETWDKREIVLEVEEDNVNAQKFYEKRGYELLFIDPASRRYDVNGLWLRQLRVKRHVMRKILKTGPRGATETLRDAAASTMSDQFSGMKSIIRKLRDNIFSS